MMLPETYAEFCSLLRINTRAGVVPFEPNTIQRARAARRTPRDIILKPRQCGFTTEECARDLWTFLTRGLRGDAGMVLAVAGESAGPWSPADAVVDIYETMLSALAERGLAMDARHGTGRSWHLGGMRLVAEPVSVALRRCRGYTAHRLHVIEAAHWDNAQRDIPMLLERVPSDGEAVIESTASREPGFFSSLFERSTRGETGWSALFFPWFQMEGYALPLDPGEAIAPGDDGERELAAAGVGPERLKWRRRRIAALDGDVEAFDIECPSTPEVAFQAPARARQHPMYVTPPS